MSLKRLAIAAASVGLAMAAPVSRIDRWLNDGNVSVMPYSARSLTADHKDAAWKSWRNVALSITRV